MPEYAMSREAQFLYENWQRLADSYPRWVAVVGEEVVAESDDPTELAQAVNGVFGPGEALFSWLPVGPLDITIGAGLERYEDG